MDIELNRKLRLTCVITLLALLVLCVLWETALAPVRPGGSWLFLKALPLAFPLRGIARGNLYTFQWASMLVLVYAMEGAVRVMSDPGGLSAGLAGAELALSALFFCCAILYVRPAKQAARRHKSTAAPSDAT
jgi:uncharacterized membrane protein